MFLFMAIFTLLSMRILKTKIMNFFPIQTLKYEKTIERDERKYNICKTKGIRILYYTECKEEIIPTNYHDKIFTNTSDLLNEITNNKIL